MALVGNHIGLIYRCVGFLNDKNQTELANKQKNISDEIAIGHIFSDNMYIALRQTRAVEMLNDKIIDKLIKCFDADDFAGEDGDYLIEHGVIQEVGDWTFEFSSKLMFRYYKDLRCGTRMKRAMYTPKDLISLIFNCLCNINYGNLAGSYGIQYL